MNKKQRNRKIVTQNKRNGMINRRYSSTIKTLYKLFQTKIKFYNLLEDTKLDEKIKLKLEIKNITNNFYSILDKAVKKNVIHKNKAARKKSNICKTSRKLNT
jgi:small subunit ribosomal protein S20